MEAAAAEFRRRGFVTIGNVLKHDHIELLRDRYMPLLDRKIARLGGRQLTVEQMSPDYANRPGGAVLPFIPIGGNRDFRRWEMHLPSDRVFLDQRLIANRIVLGVLERIDHRYRGCVCDGIGSDVAMPGCTFQRPHQDRTVLETFVNFPLVDFVSENGPIEIWPGTHQRATQNPDAAHDPGRVLHTPGQVAKLTSVAGERILIRAGDVLLRDLRAIHRGTPNLTNAPRPMLSLTYGRVRPVSRRWAIEACISLAERVRLHARRDEPTLSRPTLLNVGNALGRIAEGKGLTDRHGHRTIPVDVWHSLTPRERHVLRYALVEGGANPNFDREATSYETARHLLRFALSVSLQFGLGLAEYVAGPRSLHATERAGIESGLAERENPSVRSQ